ncbi:MAG: FkbM family methyltransferase [Deltaproteobacteria bacterium]|nr:FkbM family methyltransferase [Deltaproteobacteria bacterium]
MADGLLFVTENSFSGLSAWVALEQEDWFEDEIKFLREICQSNWVVIDVGANHGIYSMALAKAGASQILAFEPTSEPRNRFLKSIALNGFDKKIRVFPLGLSDGARTVDIALSRNSELNSVGFQAGQGDRRETIHLVDLDSHFYALQPAVPQVDFIKLDAEGEEEAILKGGQRFFTEQSPLVMFEYKHGSSPNLALISAFRRLGYSIFRLAPGVGCLEPLAEGTDVELDSFTLNLFACKENCARRLALAGRLLDRGDSPFSHPQREWLDVLLSMSVYATRSDSLARDFDAITNPHYANALLFWCGSRKTSLRRDECLCLLLEAESELALAVACNDHHPAIALLGIRILSDIGERMSALTYANAAREQVSAARIPLDWPVPPASAIFDHRLVQVSLKDFLYASVLEFIMRQEAYSFYFVATPKPLIDSLLLNPEHTPEAERRAMLCSIRDKCALHLSPSASVFRKAADNLNAELWIEVAKDHEFLLD